MVKQWKVKWALTPHFLSPFNINHLNHRINRNYAWNGNDDCISNHP